MHIEQHRRVRHWTDKQTLSNTRWALIAACAVTAALLVCWTSSQRHLHRAIERVPAVVMLERVVIAAERAPSAGRHDIAASTPALLSVVR